MRMIRIGRLLTVIGIRLRYGWYHSQLTGVNSLALVV